MYFIKKGKVKIFDIERLGFEKKQTEIKILEEGDFFGEMSLISEEPRLFSAKTIEKSTLYSINKNNLKQLLDSNSKVEKFIAETFVKRILENNNQ